MTWRTGTASLDSHCGHEYLASPEVGAALAALPSLAESFERIAGALESLADSASAFAGDDREDEP